MTDAQELAALESAYYSGARKVRTADGREVEYRDGAEMLEAIDRKKAKIAGQGRWRWVRMIPGRRGG